MATLLITSTGSLTARNLDGQGRKVKLDYETRLRALVQLGHSIEAAQKLASCQISGGSLSLDDAAELARHTQANRNHLPEITQTVAPAALIAGDMHPHSRIVRPAEVRYDNRRGWYEAA